jgi:DNA-binding MarR family transcriptional regulator
MELMKNGMNRLGPLLHDAARAMRKRFEYRTRQLGLSSAQWRLLINLAREERMTQARLADLLDVEPISVSRLIDRMEAAGWVARETDPCDRRVRLIVPTPKARLAHDDIRAIADEVYDEALHGLSATARDALIKSLNTIVGNLSEPCAEPPGQPQEGRKP